MFSDGSRNSIHPSLGFLSLVYDQKVQEYQGGCNMSTRKSHNRLQAHKVDVVRIIYRLPIKYRDTKYSLFKSELPFASKMIFPTVGECRRIRWMMNRMQYASSKLEEMTR
jgi:hypothetical protein